MDINALTGLPQPAAAVRSSGTTPAVASVKPPVAQNEQAEPGNPLAEQERQPIDEAVSSIKQFAQSIQRNLDFALDESSGRVVVKVTDALSGDVIRQIPSEDALRLAESLEEARSLLFKAEA